MSEQTCHQPVALLQTPRTGPRSSKIPSNHLQSSKPAENSLYCPGSTSPRSILNTRLQSRAPPAKGGCGGEKRISGRGTGCEPPLPGWRSPLEPSAAPWKGRQPPSPAEGAGAGTAPGGASSSLREARPPSAVSAFRAAPALPRAHPGLPEGPSHTARGTKSSQKAPRNYWF